MAEQSPSTLPDTLEDQTGWQQLAEEAAQWPPDHEGVQTLRRNHVNRLLQEKGYGHLAADEMKIRQTHYEQPRSVYYGKHPDPEIQDFTLDFKGKVRDMVRQFQETVDNGPNVNERYTKELALVHDYFSDAGLDIAPITILSAEQYKAVNKAQGLPPTIEEGGFYTYGRAVIYEGDEETRQLYGTDTLLGHMFHEATHSTSLGSETQMTTSIVGPKENGPGMARSLRETRSNGFGKPRREGTEIKEDGELWEEAFADLTRVRALMKLGREPRIGDMVVEDPWMNIIYVGEDADDHSERIEGLLTVPARFGSAGNFNSFKDCISGIAAYTLDLLDQRVPGLYDTMAASRTEPARQRDVIQMIDNVRPGLYRELRLLPYTPDGFIEGLGIVRDALAQPPTNVDSHSAS